MARNRVQDAAKTAVCARLDANNLRVAPPHLREIVKPLRFERDLEQSYVLLFD